MKNKQTRRAAPATMRASAASVAAAALLATLGLTSVVAPAAHAQQRGSIGDILGDVFGNRQNNGRGTRDDDSTTTRGASRNLRVSIATDRSTYGANRPVIVTLTVTNIGNQRVEMNKALEYDLLVRDVRSNRIVWQSSRDGLAQNRRNRSYHLDPGQSRTFREQWDQSDASNRRLVAGTYRIEGRVFPQDSVYAQVYLSDGSGRADDRYDPYDRNDPYDRGGSGDYSRRPGDRGSRDEYGQGGYGRGDYDTRDESRGLRSELRLDPSNGVIRPGESIALTYTLTNTDRSRSRTFRFGSGQQFDAYAIAPRSRAGDSVFDRSQQRGGIAWRLSQDQMYTQALTQFTLGPGERRSFTAVWRTPRNLEPGTYTLNAYLTPRGASQGRNTVYGAEGTFPATALLRVGTGGAFGGDRTFPGGGQDYGYGGRYEGRGDVLRVREAASRDYVNRRVSVSGTFRGVNPRGYGDYPVSRNDWVIEDGGTAIFVTGASAPRDRRIGERVLVSGTIRRTRDGEYYLEAD